MKYKLSPSDFKYLWEDCKHCYYQKVVRNIYLPSIGLPGIFSKMSSQVQGAVQGTNPHDLHPSLPSGTFELKEGYLKSAPIPPSKLCFINGRFDLLTRFDDGTHGVIDLKITEPKSEDLYKFSNQLHAYKFALENPLDGVRKIDKISKLGLLILSPGSVEIRDMEIRFNAQPIWHEIKEDMQGFYDFIGEVVDLLEGDVPEVTHTCKWCQYRVQTT